MNGRAFFKVTSDALQVPGGCPDCNAFQTLDASKAPVYVVRVHHDETCPTLRAMGGVR